MFTAWFLHQLEMYHGLCHDTGVRCIQCEFALLEIFVRICTRRYVPSVAELSTPFFVEGKFISVFLRHEKMPARSCNGAAPHGLRTLGQRRSPLPSVRGCTVITWASTPPRAAPLRETPIGPSEMDASSRRHAGSGTTPC